MLMNLRFPLYLVRVFCTLYSIFLPFFPYFYYMLLSIVKNIMAINACTLNPNSVYICNDKLLMTGSTSNY